MTQAKPGSDLAQTRRFNALRHGLTSRALVIPGESAEEWEAHLEGILASLDLVGAVEMVLAERVATLSWRLRRAERHECASIEVGLERVDHDFALKQHRLGEVVSLAEAELLFEDARRLLDIVENLQTMPPETQLAEADVTAILDELADFAEEDAERYLTGITAVQEDGDWTIARLMAAFKALAVRDDEDFGAVLIAAIRRAHLVVDGHQLGVARIGAEIDRMRRERLFPDSATLESIVRHETALNRMLYQALGQLEAMQSRRTGTPTSLHRIHAVGLPGG